MQTGVFTNAANTYYAAPQQLNKGGQIIGHNHVVIEAIPSLDSTQPTNPRVFAFFKGLNAAAANGKLTADVTKGLPAGTYKMSSITSAGNHQAVLMPVAQRGSVDDAVYVGPLSRCFLCGLFLTSDRTSSLLLAVTATTTIPPTVVTAPPPPTVAIMARRILVVKADAMADAMRGDSSHGTELLSLVPFWPLSIRIRGVAFFSTFS